MLTIRNAGALALFLFGTTFLWLTPSFAGPGVSARSTWWSVTNVASLVTLAGFTVATFGLVKRADWWEALGIASAVAGTLTLVPYWVAAHGSGVRGAAWNVLIHAAGNAGVFALLLVPALERWVQGHVLGGR